jgi:hypothetical protein
MGSAERIKVFWFFFFKKELLSSPGGIFGSSRRQGIVLAAVFPDEREPNLVDVFWFFFSRKDGLLPSPDCPEQPVRRAGNGLGHALHVTHESDRDRRLPRTAPARKTPGGGIAADTDLGA